jgi:hypothetical protein
MTLTKGDFFIGFTDKWGLTAELPLHLRESKPCLQ